MKAWYFVLVLKALQYVCECTEICDSEGSLRLVGLGLDTESAGRVEICHNSEWGTICADEQDFDDAWSEKNAQVVCRALGYSGALNSILHNTLPDSAQVTDRLTPIHYSQVRCSGEQESLLDCPLSENTAQCDHDRDAAIVCRLYERDGHVRLVGDTRDEVGAVELYYPGIGWTGICADPSHRDSWTRDNQAAEVVCRQLGYRDGRTYVDPLDSTFIANRSVTIDGCNVDENFELTECNTSVLTIPCTTNDLAWVQCTLGTYEYGDATKAGTKREGVVQLEFNGRRGHICDTGWDEVDAEVACVEFNLDNSRTNYDIYPEGNLTKYLSDLMPIWVTDVGCTTTTESDGEGNSRTVVEENDVIDCDISTAYPVGFTDCNLHAFRSRLALVDCGTPQDPLLPLYIVVGIFGPFIIFGLIVAFFFIKAKCCKDCEIGSALGNCCKSMRRARYSCFRHMRRLRQFTPRRTFPSRTNHSNDMATSQQVTTTEMQGGLFYEPQGDEDPPATADLSLSQPDAVKPELTDTAPPAYIEAISYATIQDKKEPPPPFVNSTL